jgi:hydrogenase expression/formation protein HypC
MCLALPGKIIKIDKKTGIATAEVKDEVGKRKVTVAMLENPQIGDWVLIHGDLAMSRITEEEARENEKILEDARLHDHQRC